MLAGADVSGFNDERGQHKVISIIIGTEESISVLHNEIGLKKIHMKNLKPNKRNLIKKKLNFDSQDILVLSLIVGKNRIVHEIHEHHKLKDRYASIGAIYYNFDHLLFNKIKPEIEQFLQKFGLDLSNLVFQCDSDMRDSLLNWKLKTGSVGKAHEFADAVAYFCKFGYKIPGCCRRNFEDELEHQLKSDLLK